MSTVFGKNTTSASITVAGHKVYYIDSTDAEIVGVQNGNNIKYNAFKFSLNGTPYWYVIDGVHDTWTDDLSAWGYSEVPVGPVLPTVTFHNGVIGTISAQGTQTVPNGSSVYLYEYSNGAYHLTEVDAGVVLAVQRVTDSSAQNTTYYGFTAKRTQEGYVKITNNTGATYTNMYGALMKVCYDSTATVVTVYDSSNNPFNAFKYTSSGTDYYYVLDGTQTDWTDDLSSIGYSLTPAVTIGYVYPDKSAKKLSSSVGAFVYDDAGNFVLYQAGKTYRVLKFYEYAGDTQGTAMSDVTWTLALESRSSGGENRLFLHPTIPYSGTQWIQRYEYTVTPSS